MALELVSHRITLNPHLHEVICGWCMDAFLRSTLVSRWSCQSRVSWRSLRANLTRLPFHTRISLCPPFSRQPSNSRRSLRADLTRLPCHTRISLCSPFARWPSNSRRSCRSLRANLTRLPGHTRISLCCLFSRWSRFDRRCRRWIPWVTITRRAFGSTFSSARTYTESKLRHVLKNSSFAHSTSSTPMYLIGLVMLL